MFNELESSIVKTLVPLVKIIIYYATFGLILSLYPICDRLATKTFLI